MYRHLGASRHVTKRLPDPLHVIAVVFNPLRFTSRYNLFREFEKHVELNAEIELTVVELAFGDRCFEITKEDNPKHIQLRTSHELWHKERMINYAVTQLPADWKYVAWLDADVTFLNPDWAHETLQQLQHYSIVQMFTHAIDISPNGDPLEFFEGFAYSWMKGKRTFPRLNGSTGTPYYGKHWHPGYGWAYRREAWDALGGLLDINIVGGGDHQMAYGLIGEIARTIPHGSTEQYSKMIKQWGDQASAIKQNIGAVPGTLVHHYHGQKVKRNYHSRWKVLTGNAFDPVTDLKKDWQLMYALTGDKIKLRDELRNYFRARNEDSTEY